MVRYIENTYEVSIDTTVEGVAYIHGNSHRGVSEAELLVQDLVLDPQEGDHYLAEVVEIKDFGCVVRLTRAQDALLHISEMTTSEKLRKKGAAELVAMGQRLRVQVSTVEGKEYSWKFP
jgi:polyribonucleotide nucleotidyltransferase